MTMREKMARAISRRDCGLEPIEIDMVIDAALDALMEPTEEMIYDLDSISNAFGCGNDVNVYRAMIRSAKDGR